MLAPFLLRFALGGVIVCPFSVVGEIFKPKTFFGMFGAAPSVALGSLALAYAEHPAQYTAVEARSMLIGATARFVYCAAVSRASSATGGPSGSRRLQRGPRGSACPLAIWGVGEALGVLQ